MSALTLRHIPMALLAVSVLSLYATNASAVWSLNDDSQPARAVAKPVSSHSLNIVRIEDKVLLELGIPDGFRPADPALCPTFQVHGKTPFMEIEGLGSCTHVAGLIRLVLGEVEGDLVRSLVLHRIMNGNTLDIRYRTVTGSYRQLSFDLTRSKPAIRSAVGKQIRIEP